MPDPRPLIPRLLEQARTALADSPADARACALEACAHARATREHRLLVRSLGTLAEACQAAGDRPGCSRAQFEGIGLALALHDVLGEHAALVAIQNADPRPPTTDHRPLTSPTLRICQALGCPIPDADTGGHDSASCPRMPVAVERRALLEKALEFASSRATNDALRDGNYLLSVGALCRELGDGERSVEYSCRALVEYERTDDRAGRAAAYNNIGDVYLRRGRYERAVEVFDTALAAQPAGTSSDATLTALGFLGDAWTFAGDLPRARNACDRLLTQVPDADSPADQARALLCKAELLVAAAELPEAREQVRAALPVVLATGVPYVEACLQRAAARLFAAQGEQGLARACFAGALATLERLDRRPELARTLADSGRFLLGLGERRQGIEQLQRAAELHRAMEAGDESLEIHRYLVQQDSQQDRRLLVLRSVSSLATQLLPAADFAARSLSLLREALKCRHGTIYLAETEQFLGDSPDDWGAEVAGDDLRKTCRMDDVVVSTRVIRLPLSLSGKSIGTACLCRTSDQGTLFDSAFLETLASLLAMGLVNGLEQDSTTGGYDSAACPRRVRQPTSQYPGIVGTCRRMQEVYGLVERVAPTSASVLVRGESGTGKELLARAIHERSGRAGYAFIAVNCAAIPETLLEAELFGIEKGTATGVSARVGKFELAHEGTLFLDEIGDMSLPLQAKLLRVLQSQTFERVGGRETLKVDVRVVAATNRDLEKAMAEGKFRQDLYYRLNVMTIALPPLRERLEDMPLLVNHFLQKYNQEFGRHTTGISPEVAEVFRRYPWQGNVRELVNVLERAVILCPTETIQVSDLPVPLQDFAREHVGKLPAEAPAGRGHDAESCPQSPGELWRLRKRTRDHAALELEQKLVADALERCQGNVAKAAREVGVSRVQFYRLMERHGLRRRTPSNG